MNKMIEMYRIGKISLNKMMGFEGNNYVIFLGKVWIIFFVKQIAEF